MNNEGVISMKQQETIHSQKYVLLHFFTIYLSITLVCAIQPTANAQTNSNVVGPKVGDQAPDFTLYDFKGNKFTLSKLTKKKAALLWFTNLCEGCQTKIPEVQKLKLLYQKKDVDVAAVSMLGEDRATVEEVMRKNNIAFRFLYDPKGQATERFSGKYVEGTCPLKNIYVIERGGKIIYASHLPGATEQELNQQLERVTKGAHK